MDTLPKAGFTNTKYPILHKKDFIRSTIATIGKEKNILELDLQHTFNGTDRQWNINNNVGHIQQIAYETIPAEKEQVTEKQRYNDYILTTLRYSFGESISLCKISIF